MKYQIKRLYPIVSNFSSRGIGVIFQLIFTIAVTNFLPLESSGEFFFFLSLLLVASAIIRLGSEQCIHRLLLTEGSSELVTKLTIIIFTLSIIVGQIVALFHLFFQNVPYVYIALILILPFHSCLILNSYLMRMSGKPILGHVFEITLTPLIFCTIVLLSSDLLEPSEASFSVIYGISVFISFALTLIEVKYDFKILSLKKIIAMKVHLKFMLPMLYLVVLNETINFTPVFLIKIFIDEESVAVYSVAQRLSRLMLFLLIVFTAFYSKKINSLYEKNEIKEIEILAQKVCSILFIISLIVLVFVWLLGEIIIKFSFGNTYIESYFLLLILLIGQVVNVSTGFVAYLMILYGDSKAVASNTLMVQLLLITVGSFLTYKLGIIGITISASIAVALINILNSQKLYRKFNLKCFPALLFWCR